MAARWSDGCCRRRQSSVAAVSLLTLLTLPGGRALQEAFNATRLASAATAPGGRTVGGPLPRRVVFAFYGEYHNVQHGQQQESASDCADFFLSEQNIVTQMIEPLSFRGVRVGVYLHTKKAGGCEDKDQALIDKLRPTRYRFEEARLMSPGMLPPAEYAREEAALSSVVDSSLKVLEIVEETEEPSETTAVVLLRYNVQYNAPINELGINWQAVNLAFRESSENWERCHMASDLLHIFPLRNLRDVSAALKKSAQPSRSHCFQRKGTGHYAYEPLKEKLGEAMLNFISPGYHSSGNQVLRLSGAGESGSPPSSTFLRIDLSCRRSQYRCSTSASLEYDCGNGKTLPEPKASSPLPRRVVLGFHGQYHRHSEKTLEGLDKCSDFFLSEQNILSNIIDPLRSAGTEVAVYFHTLRAEGCADKDQALVDALHPVQYAFDEDKLPRIVDSYLKVTQLIAKSESPSNNTAIILLRFDVQYQVPVTQLGVKWEAMNFAFRDMSEKWERCHMASDLFLVFPLSTMADVMDALDKSARKDEVMSCFNGKGTGHFMYDPLLWRLGEANMNFISPACSSSDVPPLWEQAKNNRDFLGIERTCRPPTKRCSTNRHLEPAFPLKPPFTPILPGKR